MTHFEVIDRQGVSFLKITLYNETVRAERATLCYLVGKIEIDALVPSVGRAFGRMLADESVSGRAVVGEAQSGRVGQADASTIAR
jgi:hypothetical protein